MSTIKANTVTAATPNADISIAATTDAIAALVLYDRPELV